MQRVAALSLVFTVLAFSAWAHSYRLGAIEIGHIWARATPAGAPTAAVYVPFLNNGKEADQLVEARTPIADAVTIHVSSHENGIEKMRMLDSLELPVKVPVALRPGGKHLMLTGLKHQLVAGESFPLTLRFARAGSIEVQVFVQAIGAMDGNHH